MTPQRPALRSAQVALVGPGQVGSAFLRQIALAPPALRDRGVGRIEVVALASSRRMQLSGGFEDAAAAAAGLRGPEGAGEPVQLGALGEHLRTEAARQGGVPVLVDASASDGVADRYADWLASGIHVVTPNKRAGSGPLERWNRIRAAARTGGTQWRTEATVGAGLPVLSTLRDLVATGDEVHRIEGVLSGSLAYLLHTRERGTGFSASIPAASELGYLEPDPRDDLSGTDVARKIVILAREAGFPVELGDVQVEGLVPAGMEILDRDAFMLRLGEVEAQLEGRFQALAAGDAPVRIRYLAHFTPEGGAVVGPVALATSHPLANLGPTGNAVAFTTRRYAPLPLSVQGPGAGPEVTAAGIFADLVHVVSEA